MACIIRFLILDWLERNRPPIPFDLEPPMFGPVDLTTIYRNEQIRNEYAKVHEWQRLYDYYSRPGAKVC